MEKRLDCSTCKVSIINILRDNMSLNRKVSYSGRSLIISVPEDLVNYMNLKQGEQVRIVPVDRNRFIVERM